MRAYFLCIRLTMSRAITVIIGDTSTFLGQDFDVFPPLFFVVHACVSQEL